MAVVAYELDGISRRETATDAELIRAYDAFKAARAGLVNQRNALEYVLRHMPEVDPKRIYQAGHSSAGTHSLLAAAHEPRLAGCLAYAPAVDLPQFFSVPEQRAYSLMMPGVIDFITRSSPSTHRERIRCPTFFFFAEDDYGMKPEQMRAFANALKQQGTDTTLLTVPAGGHYDSMINDGVPAGIRWLKSRETLPQR
jgi:dipeptidyl aminopeptidase/acylaminoacyl peptidase